MTTNPPSIDLIPCESSQIEGFGYDPASQILAIRFPGKGASAGSVYHYADVPAQVFEDMKAAESKGKFFGSVIRGRYAYEKQPDASGVVFGLKTGQEPKFTTSGKDGRLVTRATGKPIPDDEPVFILRAQDIHAIHALRGYVLLLEDEQHTAAVEERIEAFKAFAEANPDRMKAPDTAAA